MVKIWIVGSQGRIGQALLKLLDMLRTAVNITGDAVCTTIVSKQQGAFDKQVFDEK